MLSPLVAIEDFNLIHLPCLSLQFNPLSEVIDAGRITLLHHYLGDVLPYKLLPNQDGDIL